MDRVVKPHGDWILVELDDPATEHGGIFVIDIYKVNVHTWATVRDVGKGKVNKKGITIPNDVKVGDRVYFVYYLIKTESNKQISYSLPANHYLIKNDDILCFEQKE